MPLSNKGLWVPPGTQVRPKRVQVRGERAPDGRKYEVCPMCSSKASLRTELADDTVWECSNCGYRDSDKLGPLN